MKRIVLVLVLCLSVQLSAMAAPFVHVHADEGHETDHHDGRTTHRHVAGHDTTAHDHHGDTDTSGADIDAQFLGGMTAARALTITSLAEPVSAFRVHSPDPGTLPVDRVGPPIPTPPDISPPPLRGPPR